MRWLLFALIGMGYVMPIYAQSFPGMSKIANWTLINTASDSLGNYNDIQLINASYAGANGVWSNGIYKGDDPNGCEITTPPITWTLQRWGISVEILPKSNILNTILVGGPLWRWMELFVNAQGKFSVDFNDDPNLRITSPIAVDTTQWYRVAVTYVNGVGKLWINGQLADSVTVGTLAFHEDSSLVNYHGGRGSAYKGYMRRLTVYGATTPSSLGNQMATVPLHVWYDGDQDQLFISDLGSGRYFGVIRDLKGRVVRTFSWRNGALSLSLSDVPSGVYTLQLLGSHREQAVVRFLKR